MHFFVARLLTFYRCNNLHQRPAPTSKDRLIYYVHTRNMQDACDCSMLADAQPHCRLTSHF